MPSPDEVHQSTVERNAPRWWIAFTTGQHGGIATKGQCGIDFIPGAIKLPYLNEALISTSPFMAVAKWLDWCKLRDFEIPHTLIFGQVGGRHFATTTEIGKQDRQYIQQGTTPHNYMCRPTKPSDSLLENYEHKFPGSGFQR